MIFHLYTRGGQTYTLDINLSAAEEMPDHDRGWAEEVKLRKMLAEQDWIRCHTYTVRTSEVEAYVSDSQ